MNELISILKEYALNYIPDEVTSEFKKYFVNRYGSNLVYLIFYGSCLHNSTKRETSMYDFYVVIEDYKGAYETFEKRKRFYFLLNQFLPPNVFFTYMEVNGKRFSSKYNLISLAHMEKYTSENAPDMYIFGRLGKRVALLFYRTEAEVNRFLEMWGKSMRMNAELALHFLPSEFDLDLFILKTLEVSYMGDYRIERDTKVEELFNADKEFYKKVYSIILEEIMREKKVAYMIDGGRYRKGGENPQERERAERFIKRAKRRSIYRWPKGLMTVGDYVEYLINKVERAKGIKIELSPMERKFPLILGWKYFFKLKRRGMIK